MATISSSQIVTTSDSVFSITTDLDTNTGKQFTTINDGKGGFVMDGTPDKVLSKLASYSKEPRLAELANKSIDVITSQKESLTATYQQQVPPPNTEPASAAQVAAQNNQQKTSGENKDNDDGTVSPKAEVGSNNSTSSTNPDAGTQYDKVANDRAGTTVAGKQGTNVTQNTGTGGGGLPGARLYNPLSRFSSYTYQLALYILTPEALNAFNASGRKQIPPKNSDNSAGDGFYLIAQSGGINDAFSNRAPGFDLDYYIDELKMTTAFGYNETSAPVVTSKMTFTITEPYGFSFPTRLNNASLSIAKSSKMLLKNEGINPARLPMILAVKFYGYDNTGKPYTSTTFPGNTGALNGDEGVFEKFYDILITDLKFRLDGRATKYNITAAAFIEQISYGMKRGVLQNPGTIKGSTVKEMLDGLCEKLNQQSQKEVSSKPQKREVADVYKVVFIPEGNRISSAKMKTPANMDKTTTEVNTAKKTKDSNDATAKNTAPNFSKQLYGLPFGEPIIKHIDNIVKNSSYLEDALALVYGTTDENGEEDIFNNSKQKIQWINVQPQVKFLDFDKKINDFAYEITYVIQPYSTPYVRSTYVNGLPDYPGPHKRYDYWFTGKNSEVVSYEQQFDYLYNIISLDPDASGIGKTNIPVMNNTPQQADRSGKFNEGMEAQNSYTTSLYSPEDPSKIKLKILGDPDYLIQMPGPEIITTGAPVNKAYAKDGKTMNTLAGQVFIEINFKEPVDYNTNTGLLEVNDKITFFDKSEFTPVVKDGGVSYMVKNVTHSFNGGKFLQDIDLVLNPFTKTQTDKAKSNTGNARATTQATSNNTGQDVRKPQTTDPNSNENVKNSSQGTVAAPSFDLAARAQRAAVDASNALDYSVGSIQTSVANPKVNQPIANDDNDPQKYVQAPNSGY